MIKALLTGYKNYSRTIEMEESNSLRQSVYVGAHRALTKTIYGHKMYVDTRDLSLSPHILIDGYWEKWITNVFLEHVKQGMNIVDIGANIGYYSLIGAQKIGNKGHLICFEANPELAEILFNNLQINGYSSYSIVESKAVYSENTLIDFNICKKNLGSSSLWINDEILAPFNDTTQKITVEAVTLDTYFDKISQVNFLKIDAEGAEPFILKGAKNIIANNPDIIILMEFSPLIIRNAYSSIEDFYRELKEYGFKIKRINTDSSLQELSLSEALNTAHCDVLLKR